MSASASAVVERYTGHDWALEIGHVLDRLDRLPAGSVATVVTSPPYHGLRDYHTVPQVWGGVPDCAHLWTATPGAPVITGGLTPKQVTNAGSFTAPAAGVTHQSAALCHRCGAWHGEFGSEALLDCGGWNLGTLCGACYICHLRLVFRALWRVLRDDGNVYLNVGDNYAGSGRGPTGHNGIGNQARRQGFNAADAAPAARRARSAAPNGVASKNMMLMPMRAALALQADGWLVREDLIWAKRNPMPESVLDRCTRAHEYLWHLVKRDRYYYDAEAIREPRSATDPASEERRNRRSVWTLTTESSDVEMCTACGMVYLGKARRQITHAVRDGTKVRVCPSCGQTDAWVAHFATFPRKLVEPLVQATTSLRGGCPACGTPWRRLTDHSRTFESGSGRSGNRPHGMHGPRVQGGGATLDVRRGPVLHTFTTGWAPACRCAAGEPVPQLVLDPFAGLATTLLVALQHGRAARGIELNADYAKMGSVRITGDAPLFYGLGA